MIADFMSSLNQAECLAHFRRHGVTVGPIYNAAQLLKDDHVKQRGAYVQLEKKANDKAVVMHHVTPRLQGTPGSIRRAAPLLGEHTKEILDALGISTLELEALVRQGNVVCK
jgi:crotonobetainyl-CoA:carnitine CoA-transferase CaiB-like acyl-CoA transferase